MSSQQTCLYLTHSVCKKVCLRKRRYKWLLPRLCTKSKKYLSLQLNTTVGSLMKPSGSQNMGRNPNKGGEGSTNGPRRGVPNESCIFNVTTASLCMSVAYILEKRADCWHLKRLSKLLLRIIHTISILSYLVWGLNREVFTKLRFWSRSKMGGNR